MGYTDSLLADGEVVARREHQHWLALVLDGRAAVAVWIVAIVLFAATVFFRFERQVQDIVGVIVLVLAILGAVIFAYQWLKWRNEAYLITNRRILKVTGIVNKRSADSSLEKINDLVLEENLIGRMLGYGDLDIITAADTAIDRFRMLRNAKEFKRVMLDEKHRLETGEDIRLPGPPLMASSAPAFAAPAPAPTPVATPSAPPLTRSEPVNPIGAPADPVPVDPLAAATASDAVASAPPAPSSASETSAARVEAAEASSASSGGIDQDDDAREVTQTLSRLADLRDRGAISAEDYEQKKNELLSRL